MNLLKDKLNRLKKYTSSPVPVQEKLPPPESGWEAIGAWLEVGIGGSFILRKRSFPLTHVHGHYELRQLYDTFLDLEPLLADSATEPERILFLDTETTGLGIGAGNVPFMVGIGYYRAHQFVVEQMLIRNPAEEAAMLAYLTELMQSFDCLATYNGKTFDWPILKNRMILNRITLTREQFNHLDFLYPSRSLWRNTLPSCRLSKVEESRLGFFRHDDVPGSLAPTLYFQYLAEQNPLILQGVFKHNEQDILSLAGLAIHFSRALNGSLDLSAMEAGELFRLGLWLDQHGKSEMASVVYEQILGLPGLADTNVCYSFSLVLKKKGRMDEAVWLWKQIVDVESKLSADYIEACVELSKYYEHKQKDYGTAFDYVERAISKTGERAALLRASKRSAAMQELRKRKERLREKEIRQSLHQWKQESLYLNL